MKNKEPEPKKEIQKDGGLMYKDGGEYREGGEMKQGDVINKAEVATETALSKLNKEYSFKDLFSK